VVVAVGNPYLLIKTEKNMAEQFSGPSHPCWTPFLRKCLTFHQFHLPECVLSSTSEEAYRNTIKFFNTLLFKGTFDFSGNLGVDDTILKEYAEAYEQEHTSKVASKLLTRASKQSMLEHDLEADINYEDIYDCILEATSFNEAKGIPLDSKKSTVHILGKQNRVGALNGDTVKVGTFADFLEDKVYGKVIEVIDRVPNLNFVCEVSLNDPDTFYPIDIKNPGFKNFPYYSKKLREHQDDAEDKFNRPKSVVVYNQATWKKEGSMIQAPKVADFINHRTAIKMAFVVKFIAWNPKFTNAFGLVIEAYPKGYTHLNAEILLNIVHSLPLCRNNCEEDSQPPQSSSLPPAVQCDNVPFPNAFTIDPKGARN